jgi:diadenosine tetraphosphate (Ap4A) HIT family hydrolase
MADRGWPDDWDERVAGRGCPMCATVGQGDNDYAVEVFRGEFAEVQLERRTSLPGYCVVIWRHQHVADPADLDPAQACGYWAEVLAVGRAVRARFDPVKLNRPARVGRVDAQALNADVHAPTLIGPPPAVSTNLPPVVDDLAGRDEAGRCVADP